MTLTRILVGGIRKHRITIMRRSLRLEERAPSVNALHTRPAMAGALSGDMRTFANQHHAFVRLPIEIFHQVLLYVENAIELTNLSLTCKALALRIDHQFWKRLYFRQDFHLHPLPSARGKAASRNRKCYKRKNQGMYQFLLMQQAWEAAPYLYSPSSMGDPLSLNQFAFDGTSFLQTDVFDWQTQYTFAWLYKYEKDRCGFCRLQNIVNHGTFKGHLQNGIVVPSKTKRTLMKCHCFGVVMCTSCILKQVVPEELVYRYYALEPADIRDLPVHYFPLPHSDRRKGPRHSRPHFFRPHLVALRQQKFGTQQELNLILEENATMWNQLMEHNEKRKIFLRNVLWQFGFESFASFYTCIVRVEPQTGSSLQFRALAEYYQHNDKSQDRQAFLSFERAFTDAHSPEATALKRDLANDTNPMPNASVADQWLMYLLKQASGYRKRFDDLEKTCAKSGIASSRLDAVQDSQLASYIRGSPGYLNNCHHLITHILTKPVKVKAPGSTRYQIRQSQIDLFEEIIRDEEIMTTAVVNSGHVPHREKWQYWLEQVCSVSPAYSPAKDLSPEDASRVLADVRSVLRKIEDADGTYSPMLYALIPEWYNLCPYEGEKPAQEHLHW